jgi:hypothetical protein
MPVGADATAVYTMRLDNPGHAELWRYPVDGGAPSRLTESPNPLGGLPLLYSPPSIYAGSLPTFVVPGAVIEAWVVGLPDFSGNAILLVQRVAVG